MWQEVARLKLNKIKTAQSGVLMQGTDNPANFRVNLYGSISASPLSKTAAASGTLGFKVAAVDNFGAPNEITLDLESGPLADNSFGIGILETGTSVPILWSVKITPNFPADCFFTLWAILEQDVESFPTV